MVISPFHLYSHSSNQLYFTSHPCLSKYICPNLKDALPTTQTRNTRRMGFCLDSNLSSNLFGQSQYSLIEIIPRWKIEYVLQWLKSKDHDHNPPCATRIPGLQLFPSSAISLPHWLYTHQCKHNRMGIRLQIKRKRSNNSCKSSL